MGLVVWGFLNLIARSWITSLTWNKYLFSLFWTWRCGVDLPKLCFGTLTHPFTCSKRWEPMKDSHISVLAKPSPAPAKPSITRRRRLAGLPGARFRGRRSLKKRACLLFESQDSWKGCLSCYLFLSTLKLRDKEMFAHLMAKMYLRLRTENITYI